jgi:glycosyltransferase involved in cell wall biosynthesis
VDFTDVGGKRSAVLVWSYPGQPSARRLAALAAADECPRKDYIELADALQADIIDADYLMRYGGPVTRALTKRFGAVAGQLFEAWRNRKSFNHIWVSTERIGLPLALLHKLGRSRKDVIMTAAFLTPRKKAVFVRHLRVHTHLRAIVFYSTVQLLKVRERMGVPAAKLHAVKHPVDDKFWRPGPRPTDRVICSVGWEARDYSTLVKAVAGLDVEARLAIGVANLNSFPLETSSEPDARQGSWRPHEQFAQGMAHNYTSEWYTRWLEELEVDGLPANVVVDHQLRPVDLRALYARSRFVVIPLHDVDFDAGVTTLTEAMAMGKAVIISRTRGQVDVIRHGEHGLVVPPADPVALRAAIQHLLDHPDEAERMGRAGRDLAEREHRLTDHIAHLVNIANA